MWAPSLSRRGKCPNRISPHLTSKSTKAIREKNSEAVLLSELAKQNIQKINEHYSSPASLNEAEKRKVFQDIHERVIHTFAMSPSFGVSRVPLTFAALSRSKHANSREQSKFEVDFVELPLSISEVDYLPVPTFVGFSEWLLDSIYRFVPVESLGFQAVDDRVAGFFAHGRKDYARPPDGWNEKAVKEYEKYRVKRLELISLLLHETPVAYAGNSLPAMEQVTSLKTRALDSFETMGLLKLQSGEDLYVKEYKGRTLILGALRNAKQCQSCHQGESGRLLGAFRYDLEKIK